MVVKIHGYPVSTCTRAVTVTLKELRIPYEIILVDLKAREQKSAKHIANLQPFGQTPILVEDDGFKVFESRAIARYLIAKYGPDSGLVPKDLKKNALFEQAMSIENNNFYTYADGLCTEKVFKPARGLQGSEERAAEYAATLEEKLKVYETILSKQKYLAGNELTLADLLHLPCGAALTEHAGFNGLKATPNVARWWEDISSRDSWKAVQAEMNAFLASQSKK